VEAFIRFGSIPALFYASNAYCIDSPIMLEIVCEHATYQISGDDLTILHTDGPTDTFSSASLTGEGEVYWGSGHKLCIADFYQSIEEKVHFPITPLDIRQTMSLVYGCYESASKGKTIQLDERKEQNEIRRDELRP
jgi:predicted dehydrogenase